MEPADQQRRWSSDPSTLGRHSTAGRASQTAPAAPEKLAGPAYATALEQAMAEQQREIALSRNEIEAARQEALQARRSEEHTKTELINARAKFAMDVAEVDARAPRGMDDRCERGPRTPGNAPLPPARPPRLVAARSRRTERRRGATSTPRGKNRRARTGPRTDCCWWWCSQPRPMAA